MLLPGQLSLKHKLVIIIMGIAFFALLFAGIVLVRTHLHSLKTNLSRNLSVLAGTIGSNGRAALYFGDAETAQRILSSIREEPQVQFAAMYDSNRNLFAQFSRNPKDAFRKRTTADPGVRFTEDGMEVLQPILLKEQEIGSIYLFSDLREYHTALRDYIFFFGIILALTLALCLLLAVRIQRIISNPILKLAEAAESISRDSNYSIRVNRTESDEIGKLYSGFNIMLEAIANRESELIAYKNNLEDLIRHRTQELETEISARRKIEEDLKGSLKDKEILLREINHRAKNNMQIISSLLLLQAYQISEKEYSRKFRDCALRLQHMALIHENLYDSEHLHDINLKALITKLGNNLGVSYDTRERVNIRIDIEEINLDIEKNILCGLIIHELASNSLKHGFPGESQGEVHIIGKLKPEGTIELQVKDNGVGLVPDFDLEKTTSVGLSLVTSLVRDKLNGEMAICSSNHSCFTISFPRN